MVTSKWKTVATVGFQPIIALNENRSADGGVCHLQARKGKSGLLGRKVNSNGRHEEIGVSFTLDEETLLHWQSIAKASR